MIDYIFRNHTTGMELKRTRGRKIGERRLKGMDFKNEMDIPDGYELQQVVDYRVSKKERKAK